MIYKFIGIAKYIISFLRENKGDVLKFVFYTSFFFFLFFAFEKANSPEGAVTYNSASEADNSSTSANESTSPSFTLGSKAITRPLLTLQFNPSYVKIDVSLLKSLKVNIASNFLKSKVTPLDVTIDTLRKDPRGQVSGNKLILSGKIGSLDETVKVFVHELGHIIDLHFLPDLGDYDPSENFYNISWLSYNVKKKNSKMQDYVSGYALTNKYEDFAESFTFFIFHNETFKKRAEKNIVVARKYNFFKKYVFLNSEFSNTSFEIKTIPQYNWDSTKIRVNLNKYLYYIR